MGTKPSNTLEAQLEALNRAYRQSFPDKRQSLQTLWRALDAPEPDADAAQQLHRFAHQLSGSAGSYGYADLGELAAGIELTLAHQARRGPKAWARTRLRLERQVTALSAALAELA
ncbi:MAG: hypothetical protein HKN58_02710 [Xanthomonadales bacterium]|nr:hypothetical protein [Xanthomonadales bacterium]